MKHTRPLGTAGITIPECLVLLIVLLAVAAFALPNFAISRGRHGSQQNTCINNLRQIDGAKEQWMLEMKKTAGEPCVDSEVNAYIKGLTRPVCPLGGTYVYNRVGTLPACSLAAKGHTL